MLKAFPCHEFSCSNFIVSYKIECFDSNSLSVQSQFNSMRNSVENYSIVPLNCSISIGTSKCIMLNRQEATIQTNDDSIPLDKNIKLEIDQIDGLMQERRNSSALAVELRLSCINPSKCKLQINLFRQYASLATSEGLKLPHTLQMVWWRSGTKPP